MCKYLGLRCNFLMLVIIPSISCLHLFPIYAEPLIELLLLKVNASNFLWYGQVPVRVACGLLFELLGQSAGDPLVNEDDIPIVLRSWQSQNFLVTSLHVKGSAQNINVLGIVEVQVCSCLQH